MTLSPDLQAKIQAALEEAITKETQRLIFGAKAKTPIHVGRPAPTMSVSHHPPYGTMMSAINGTGLHGMALGNGSICCFEHDAIESDSEWEVDTE